MSRQSLLDYLLSKTDVYESADEIGATRGGGDFQALYSPICERPLFHTGYDVFGVHWTQANPTSHYTPGQKPIMEDIEEWESQVRFPVVDRFDWGYVAEQTKHLDRDNRVITVTLAIGPFERANTLTSFEDGLVNSITNPEEYSELIGAIADYKIEVIKKLYDIAHPDFINLHDDWGTAQNTFLRPEQWRSIVKPHTQRMYDVIHERGMIVSQHSCGCIQSLLDDMVEMGCDVWEGNGFCNDIPRMKERYAGKLCIFAPPIKEEERLGKAPVKPKPAPPIESTPLCYRPYSELPYFLYK